MNRYKKISAFIILALALAACSKESVKTLYASQETKIETIVKALIAADETGTAYSVSRKGSQRVVLAEGSGDTLSPSGTVKFYYAGYTLPSATISASNLFDTNVYEIAKQTGRDTTDLSVFEPFSVKLSSDNLVKGLKNGLVGVKAGEQCYVLFSGKYGFGGKELGTIPANSALAYALQIVEVTQ